MKNLKILGLVVVTTLALMAFFGSSTASALIWCKTNQSHCAAGWDKTVGTEITWTLKVGTAAVLKAAFSEVKCSEGHKAEHIIRTGEPHEGIGREPKTQLTTKSFGGCKCGERTAHVTTTELGEVEVGAEGTITETSTRVTIQCTGLASCIFGTVAGGTDMGVATDSSETGGAAEAHESGTLTWSSGTGDSGQFICAGFGDTGTMTASWVLSGEASQTWKATTGT